MANIKISQLSSLATLADTTVLAAVDAGTNYKVTGSVVKTYTRGSVSLATPATASAGGALGYVPSTGVFTFTPADKTNLVNNGKTLQLDSDGELSLPTNSYTEAVIKELSATALVLFAQTSGGNVKLLAGATSAGSAKQWLFNGTDGTLSSKMFLANEGSTGSTGYSFTGDGSYDTGMFSSGDGYIQFYSNAQKVAEVNPTGYVTTFSKPLKVTDVRDTIYSSGGTTGTITPDCANGDVQTITLTGSITLNAFANPVTGQTMTLIITQPASGGPYTLTSSMKFAGGLKTLSTAASAIDMLTISYIGTTYYASLVTGFA